MSCNDLTKMRRYQNHYNDAIRSATASENTSLTIVYSTVYSGAHQRKHQSSASLAFVRGIHWWPVNKGPVTRKMISFDDVIMISPQNGRHVTYSIIQRLAIPQARYIATIRGLEIGFFYWHGLTLIPALISNYINYIAWNTITYPFPNLNGCAVEVWGV